MKKRRAEDDSIRMVVHQRNRLSIVCEASKEKMSRRQRPTTVKDSLWIESLGTLQISFRTI
jgi:hypothetical protein